MPPSTGWRSEDGEGGGGREGRRERGKEREREKEITLTFYKWHFIKLLLSSIHVKCVGGRQLPLIQNAVSAIAIDSIPGGIAV